MPPAHDLSAHSSPLRAGRSPAAAGTTPAAAQRGATLARQQYWLVSAVVLLCLLVALVVQQWAARAALVQQLGQQNRASAQWLALALNTEAGRDPAQREALLGAHVASARLHRLELRDAEGRTRWAQRAEVAPVWAPAAYAELLALTDLSATAPLRNAAGEAAGSVLVEAQGGDAVDVLWQGLLQSVIALGLVGLAVLVGAAWGVRSLRRLLADAVAQADAFCDGRYTRVAPPSLPELQPLAASMNLLGERVQALFDTQAAELEQLRRHAHLDSLTGLPLRRFFVARLEQALGDETAPAELGLLLLRVRDLTGMNRRVGHAQADQVLQAIARILQSYPQRADGCFAGRLNGSDFALVLPVGGVADETAQSLVRGLRLPLVTLDAAAAVAIGAVELGGGRTLPQALALADEALGQAEAMRPYSAVTLADAGAAVALGAAGWQQRLSQALEQGRVALAEFPVCTADGRVLHLDCPMRVQLEAGGAFEPALRWLAQAQRARLSAAVDERAIELALQAIENDGRARCINLSAQSLGVSDFMAAVSRRLEAAPQAATRLWIDLPEALALDRPALVQEASRRWRPLGVYLGLEHAGEGLARIHRLTELGLDCVRIDARFVRGLAAADASDDARRYLRGLVQLVQSVGISIAAEGVNDDDDLQLLWSLGFDAATGPAVTRAAINADAEVSEPAPLQPISAKCSG
ncbi:EAL domain-containing protein [Aquincola sp. S2]|uniref:EAL domain-containing protein n=1 Tax=Pseudaquabacterium terrae TaxID=2732868 RepID=A0ABX2EK43_9BURK|nr:EAL domain-containing protein [Aquabacterium terrae]NRF68950.1 EAL domain-containing protein [Aquabacterium terrae]